MMNKEQTLWTFISDQLKKDRAVALLMVGESTGSSPGRPGFKMAVNQEGDLCGSIGGGIMEIKLVELAKSQLQAQDYKILVKRQIHNKTAPRHQSGMICSGEQTVILYFLKKQDLKDITLLGSLLTRLHPSMIHISNSVEGPSFKVVQGVGQTSVFHFLHHGSHFFELSFSTGYSQRLYIIGGGHCALALSEIMSKLDFQIILLDDRPGLSTMIKNHFVQEKQVLSSFNNLTEFIVTGSDVYVVVMTLGYRTDEIVIRELLQYDFKYLGLLGSKAKVKTLLESLEKDGYSKDLLNRVHAPIGLNINSRTPEEIAISIAAQLIAVKNQPRS
jgi:xanthine dehydrogenase accessory factor